ncbi:MAG TPA: MFS transporter [Alphaproteobacteria bacterium]|nr:MFS transporter [Alphaproteobacteria bacterium]
MKNRMFLIVGAGCVVLFLALGTRQSFGLFLAPMSKELGWGREIFSLAIGLQNLLWGLSQPFIGAIADRYGPGRVVALGAVFYAVGLYIMSVTATPMELHLGAGLVIGVSLSAISFAVVFGAVARVVPQERQGMALGVVGAMGSAGQFLVVLGNQALLDAEGWRTTFLICAVVIAALLLPLAYPIRRRAAADGSGAATIGGADNLKAALNEAFGHRGFWLLNAGFFVCGYQVTFIATHLPAYVSDQSLPGWVGGTALALVGAFNIVGSFACGTLGDKYRKKYLLSLLYILRAVVIAGLLLAPPSATNMLIFGAAMGLLWLGTVPLTSSLVAQIFGVRYMTTLFGVVFFSHQAGAFLGVWLGGKLYDMTGSYDVVWMIAFVLGIAAALLHWPIADTPVARAGGTVPAKA